MIKITRKDVIRDKLLAIECWAHRGVMLMDEDREDSLDMVMDQIHKKERELFVLIRVSEKQGARNGWWEI